MQEIKLLNSMFNDTEIRKKILKKISRMPTDKLNGVLNYLKKIDLDRKNKNQILFYAGIWSDLDNETFSALTDQLIDRRKSSSRRE